jgi:SAM-dependent methyltransferase
MKVDRTLGHASQATQDVDAIQRASAYTHVRDDVASLVPNNAFRILDVGCSNGALGGYLKARVAQRHLTGIEFDADFARAAGQVLDAVIHADVETLDLEDALKPYAPFDCIVCADVLEHLREPWRHLGALARTLSPSGSLILGLPNIRHHSALATIFFRGSFPRRARGIFDATHLRWFTWKDGVALLRDAGLEPDTAEYAVRIGDQGGGLVNHIADRLLNPFAGRWLIREFFVYQFVIRSRRAQS